MLYRKNPKNGDELSVLGFGCMRLPVKEDGTVDEERATSQVRYDGGSTILAMATVSGFESSWEPLC